MKKIINVILLFFTFIVYSQDTLKWSFKYSGYVDLKTIKLPSGGQIINLFNYISIRTNTNKTKYQ